MFRITDKTCRAFSLAEILIMAAINVESSRCGIPNLYQNEYRGKATRLGGDYGVREY